MTQITKTQIPGIIQSLKNELEKNSDEYQQAKEILTWLEVREGITENRFNATIETELDGTRSYSGISLYSVSRLFALASQSKLVRVKNNVIFQFCQPSMLL